MNTMLADSLNWISSKLETELNAGKSQSDAVVAVLKDLMNEHGNAVFGGDGYSSEWHKMAVEERGLKNIPTTADALPAFRDDAVKELFESTGVLSPVELESRFEIYAEQYILSIEVEAKLVVDMAKTTIYPVAIGYLSDLSVANASMADMGITLDNSLAKTIATEANAMMAASDKLVATMAKESFGSTEEHLQHCANDIRGLMEEVRAHADTLEANVADDVWPLPKYQEMLFIK